MPCNGTSHEIPVLYQGHCPFQTSCLMTCPRAASSLAVPSGWCSCPIPAIPIPTCSGAGLEPKPAETEVQTHPSLTILAEGHGMDPLIVSASHSLHAGMGLAGAMAGAMQLSTAGQLTTYGSLARPWHAAASVTAVCWGCPRQRHALQEEGKGYRKELQ